MKALTNLSDYHLVIFSRLTVKSIYSFLIVYSVVTIAIFQQHCQKTIKKRHFGKEKSKICTQKVLPTLNWLREAQVVNNRFLTPTSKVY